MSGTLADPECQEFDLAEEHMCRPCGHCGYGWAEATADANADAQ